MVVSLCRLDVMTMQPLRRHDELTAFFMVVGAVDMTFVLTLKKHFDKKLDLLYDCPTLP